ncbi:glycosyl transferases group 1 family protein [Listeria grandensis FSL F6-0971]|uniref:Glycosyl transferases group 1 family protein n=1 Tax=Listeria grandensis FSL F6-0971 TaxID=1265819 RepID=W7B788_9LIST|nr:glycosyltransferase family 4 protein [Listeria grandensis]EUJ23139.1 glycosyl transferases group 1 family protein [Listeria grandensis FSL F6-0971]
MKHILMVSHDYLPNIGGIAVYVHELGRALVARGHRVTILTQYRSFRRDIVRERRDGMLVIRIPIVPLKKLDDWQYVRRMRRMITELERTEQIDVVHWQTMNKDAKVMRGLKVQALEVYTNHLSWFRMLFNDGEFSRIKRLIRRPDVIISPSREVEAMSAELYGAQHVVYLPNGVDADVFKPDAAADAKVRARYGIATSETVIVSTNRMEPVKGMTYLMAAIPSILATSDNVTFLVAGDGSQSGQFQQEIAKIGSQAKKGDFYRKADE